MSQAKATSDGWGKVETLLLATAARHVHPNASLLKNVANNLALTFSKAVAHVATLANTRTTKTQTAKPQAVAVLILNLSDYAKIMPI